MQDEQTARFYAENAATYVRRSQVPYHARLDDFLTTLPDGSAILELGCGSGRDSAEMLARGYDVTPTDGTPEIARQATALLGRPVGVLRFEDIDFESAFDGIWVNAALLHVARDDLPRVLAAIYRALRPAGVSYASFKAGDGEGRDMFGRYYNYPSEAWLRDLYQRLPWVAIHIDSHHGGGYDDRPTEWLHVTAIKPKA
jgi:SAM-dependent methyltransferase